MTLPMMHSMQGIAASGGGGGAPATGVGALFAGGVNGDYWEPGYAGYTTRDGTGGSYSVATFIGQDKGTVISRAGAAVVMTPFPDTGPPYAVRCENDWYAGALAVGLGNQFTVVYIGDMYGTGFQTILSLNGYVSYYMSNNSSWKKQFPNMSGTSQNTLQDNAAAYIFETDGVTSTSRVYGNGVLLDTGTHAVAAGATAFSLFANSSGGNDLNGSMRGLMIIDKILSPAEKTVVQDWRDTLYP